MYFSLINKVHRLFVYGSLRSSLHNAIYSHITRYFILEGMGAVQGKLYDMGEYPGGIPTTDDAFIHGEVYRISDPADFDCAMAYLDEYEGLTVPPGEIPLFRREPIPILFRNTTVMAWMYWYNREITNEYKIESGDFVAYKLGLGK